MASLALGTQRAQHGHGLSAGPLAFVGWFRARARVLATLPPRTVMPVRVESGCVLPSRVARLELAQSRAVVWLLGHTLGLLDWRRCVWDMEGMARRCLSRSPLLAVAPVAGVPMSAL